MGLPFSIPSYIDNGKDAIKHALEIECYNLGTECLGRILVDDRFWLEGHEASSSFFLIPKDVAQPSSYADATFYADCLAFEHEFSAIAFPKAELIGDDDVPWDVYFRDPESPPGLRYLNGMREGSEVANRLNLGVDYSVVFKYDWFYFDVPEDGITRIAWITMFENISSAIHLYNAALRQMDPLTQFLCFYRVIENVAGNNGKHWIETTLTGPLEYAVPVWCVSSLHTLEELISPTLQNLLRPDQLNGKKNQFNVLEVTRAKALHRLTALRLDATDHDIAKRLYNANRCGIAHGSHIRRHDISDDFLAVLQDLPLIRYLGRLAIESQMTINTT